MKIMIVYLVVIVSALLYPLDAQSRYNAAFSRSTWQSTTHASSSSWHAVDGCLETDISKNCCAQTELEVNPWLSVDIGALYVRSVTVVNGEDSSGNQLANFTVYTSSVSPYLPHASDKQVCYHQEAAVASGATETFLCNIIRQARYVIFSVDHGTTQDTMHICELQVHACSEPQCALCTVLSADDCVQCDEGFDLSGNVCEGSTSAALECNSNVDNACECESVTCVCPGRWYKCRNAAKCITLSWRCNKIRDCPNGDDEDNCGPIPAQAPVTGIACEGNVLRLQCSGSKSIQILSVNYGRPVRVIGAAEVCPSTDVDTDCRSAEAPSIVNELCNGKASCEIDVTNAVLGGDPCAYVSKYLEVNYRCFNQL